MSLDGRQWRIEIDWLELVPVNRWFSGHWSKKAALVTEWREAAIQAAQLSRLPKRLDRFRLDVQARHQKGTLTDPDAFAAAAKAICDGLILYGLAEDDSGEFFDGLHLLPPYMDKTKRPALIVVVTEVIGGPGAVRL